MLKQSIFNVIGYAVFIGAPIFFIIKATQTVFSEGKQPTVVKSEVQAANDRPLPVYIA
ncbi:MAG: hypothetical protein WAW86_01100 [Gammaproteobacteria bacterium]